ncbi:MAG: hypothetical protein WDZ84_04255 [Rhodovibrionaceae bacterium]
MRHVIKGAAIGLGLLALSAGTALAQDNANANGPDSVIIQNHGTSPNSGQQGGNLQLHDSTQGTAGDNSTAILSGDDVSVDAVSAQSIGATAVGGNLTEVGTFGNLADGDIVEVDGDLAVATTGHAVEDGATTVSGGIAFGSGFEVDDSFAVVGGDGAALLSEDNNLADEGSAIVVGDSNATATAHDDAAAVGDTGTALYVDSGDDGNVFGSDNVVSMNELDQEVATDDGGPIFSVGAWTPETTADLDAAESASNPTIATGDIGGADNPISINGMAGLNAFHVNTGAMNQGSIHAVAVSADSLTLN